MISSSLGFFMVMTIVFTLLAVSHLLALLIAVGRVKGRLEMSFALCSMVGLVFGIVALILAVVQGYVFG